MKLKIIDYFWSVGHRTKRKGSHKIPLAEGELHEINYVQFRIDKVEKDKAQISVIRRDGTVIKEITVEKGKSANYRPMSMDAGHEYVLKLTKIF